MENSEKTTALNKAYAEIILNTAKESAARVMVSDRKSARFQHDLCGTKEEALRLLVRMKQMIDAKTIEAEITSSNQQQQIDVLEAQLQEAEDIITDLRSELRWVRDKLEKAKANELQARNAVNKEKETVSAQNADQELVGSLKSTQEVADTCVSISSGSLLNQSSLHDERGNDLKQFDDGLSINTVKSCDACESGLDTNGRNKKLELSRNGCTQRIRALERKTPERNSSSSADVEEQFTVEKDSDENLSSEKVIKTESGACGNTRCIVLALRSSNIEAIPNLSNALRIKKTGKACKLRGRRKRRWGKRKTTSVRSLNRLLKPCQSHSDLPCSSTSADNSNGEDPLETHLSVESEKVDALNASKELEEHLQLKRTLYTDDIAILRKGKRSKNMKTLGSLSSAVKPSDHLAMVCGESNLVSSNVNDGENKADILANETETEPLPCLDPVLTLTKSNMDPISGSTNATVSLKETNRSTDKELRSRKEDVLVKTEGEDGLASSSKVGSEFDNVHSMSSDSKVTPISDQISESPKADGNRYVKYTFQRKRKKGCLSENDDNNYPGKREVEEKENNAQDTNESIVGNEPSKGTQQLPTVARQLIALSGK